MGRAAASPASRIEGMRQKRIVVNTPNAALAVRGTHFWGGADRGEVWRLAAEGKGARERTLAATSQLKGSRAYPCLVHGHDSRSWQRVSPTPHRR